MIYIFRGGGRESNLIVGKTQAGLSPLACRNADSKKRSEPIARVPRLTVSLGALFRRTQRRRSVTPIAKIRLLARLTDWLTDWLIGWLAGWLTGWLISRGWPACLFGVGRRTYIRSGASEPRSGFRETAVRPNPTHVRAAKCYVAVARISLPRLVSRGDRFYRPADVAAFTSHHRSRPRSLARSFRRPASAHPSPRPSRFRFFSTWHRIKPFLLLS